MALAYIASLVIVFVRLAAATLTAAEKTGILDRHNALRASISTPCTASDMQKLIWDDTLATAAQSWADGCVGQHASGAGSTFGENLWMSYGADVSASQYTSPTTMINAVDAWYAEGVDAKWELSGGVYLGVKQKTAAEAGGTCVQPEGSNCVIGHFTQVVWAKTKKIGCGVKSCTSGFTSLSGSSDPYGTLLVCRYDPSGNVKSNYQGNDLYGMPFIPGSPCAACAGSCTTTGLCDPGATINRCSDTCGATLSTPPTACRFNSVDYTDCTGMVGQISGMLSQSGLAACSSTIQNIMTLVAGCPKTCGSCTDANGVGSSHCGGSPTPTPPPTPTPSPKGNSGAYSIGTTGLLVPALWGISFLL